MTWKTVIKPVYNLMACGGMSPLEVHKTHLYKLISKVLPKAFAHPCF